jgi:sulfite exporter TauE/SafE
MAPKGEHVQLSKVPPIVWVCLTVAFLGVLSAYVYLDVSGTEGAEFRGFMNIVMNAFNLLVTAVVAALAGQAAHSAKQAANQTNGDLDRRLEAAADRALQRQRAADVQPGGELRRG